MSREEVVTGVRALPALRSFRPCGVMEGGRHQYACQHHDRRDRPDVAEGSTILDAARAAGIRIPTLCFLKERSAIASYRVRVVDVEGLDQLVPALVRHRLCKTSMKVTTSLAAHRGRTAASRSSSSSPITASIPRTTWFSCDKERRLRAAGRLPRIRCAGVSFRGSAEARARARREPVPRFTTRTCASAASAAWAPATTPRATTRWGTAKRARCTLIEARLARDWRATDCSRAATARRRAHRARSPRSAARRTARGRPSAVRTHAVLRRGLSTGPRSEGRRHRGCRGGARSVEPKGFCA